MGICGLLGHCIAHKDECVECVDLVTVASLQAGGVELLCDFYAFEYLVATAFWDSLSTVTGNQALRLMGGEYLSLHNYVTKLVGDLQSLGIDLVMFVDAAKGCNPGDWKCKFETWRYRFTEDVKRCWAVVDFFTRHKPFEEVLGGQTIRPVLLDLQMLETLKQCGCLIVQCTDGEADLALINAHRKRPRAFAILSNDSDFCVFSDCRLIPHDLFDLCNNLKLGKAQLLPSRPTHLWVGIMSTAKVAKVFGFGHQDSLVELGILAGNDFTKPYVRDLQRKLHLLNRGVPILLTAAQWVRQHGKLENNSHVAEELRHNVLLADVVQYSRDFYSGQLHEKDEALYSPLGICLKDGVKSGLLPCHVLAMHRGFYWQRAIVEDLHWHGPSIEQSLAPLRAYIYRMVLDGSETNNAVTECGRSMTGELDMPTVKAASDPFLPSANLVLRTKSSANATVFLRIMNHQESRDLQIDWFQKYDRRTGFCCCVLRYVLILSSRVDFHLTKDEFVALVAAVFANSADVLWYQHLCVMPGIRCVTIGNWFQDVYRHAFAFIGKLLCLSDDFPRPKDCFSGAVFATYYAISTHVLKSMSQDLVDRAMTDFDSVISEKHDIICTLIAGYL